MFPVLSERGPLPPPPVHFCKPPLRSLCHGRAFARRNVQPLADINLDRCVIVIRVFLALECLDMPVALLVNVIDNPSLFRLAFTSGPTTFADRHAPLLE